MANAISKMLSADVNYLKAHTLPGDQVILGIDHDVNKMVSDACCSPEGKEFLELLGTDGKASKDSLSVGTGKVSRASGYKLSPAWAWAVKVNKLARAMRAEDIA